MSSSAAGSVNPFGMAERVGVAARQASLTEGVVLDTRRVVAEIGKGKLTPDVARAACEARMDRNERRIRAVLGDSG